MHSGGSSLASTASRRLCRRSLAAWALSKNFSRVASESDVGHSSLASFEVFSLRGALATGCGCILGAVAWLQLPRGAFAGSILGAVAWLQLPFWTLSKNFSSGFRQRR